MNQDMLKTILNRIPWSMVLFVFLAVKGFDYYQFNNAEDSPKSMKLAEIDQTKVQIDQLRKKLKEAQEFQKSLDAKREELRGLASELAGMKAGLNEDFDVPELIRMVTREATMVGLSVSSFQPAEERQHEYYTEKVLRLQFTGVYVQLVAFLNRLASLQKIVRVDGFELKPRGGQEGKHVDLTGMLNVMVYRYAGSKADEIANTAATPAPAGAVPAEGKGDSGR